MDRFSDKLPEQYYYTRLQDASQWRDESAEVFGDRCRKLCQRRIRKVQDEEVQRIINDEAERRLFSSVYSWAQVSSGTAGPVSDA